MLKLAKLAGIQSSASTSLTAEPVLLPSSSSRQPSDKSETANDVTTLALAEHSRVIDHVLAILYNRSPTKGGALPAEGDALGLGAFTGSSGEDAAQTTTAATTKGETPLFVQLLRAARKFELKAVYDHVELWLLRPCAPLRAISAQPSMANAAKACPHWTLAFALLAKRQELANLALAQLCQTQATKYTSQLSKDEALVRECLAALGIAHDWLVDRISMRFRLAWLIAQYKTLPSRPTNAPQMESALWLWLDVE